MEIMGGRAVLEHLLNNESVMNNVEKNAIVRTQDTLFMQLMKGTHITTLKNELLKYT